MNIREEIAEVIATGRVRREDCTCEIWKRGRASTCPECTARKIVTLLKEHIEGLGVISDEERGDIIRNCQTGRPFKTESEIALEAAQAELQHILEGIK